MTVTVPQALSNVTVPNYIELRYNSVGRTEISYFHVQFYLQKPKIYKRVYSIYC